MAAFQRALTIQMRVLGALMLREIVATTSLKSMVGLVLRPAMVITGMYIAGSIARGLAPHGFPLLIFSGLSYLTWFAFIQYFIAVNMRGASRLLTFPHITTLDLILARLGADFAIYTVVFVAFVTLGTLFKQVPPPADLFGVMIGFWSSLMLGLSLGLIMTCIYRFTKVLNAFVRAIHYMGHLVSGVFLLASDTPDAIMRYLRWNPVLHCVEYVRQSWWAAYRSPVADLRYIFICLVLLFTAGLSFERLTRRWEEG